MENFLHRWSALFIRANALALMLFLPILAIFQISGTEFIDMLQSLHIAQASALFLCCSLLIWRCTQRGRDYVQALNNREKLEAGAPMPVEPQPSPGNTLLVCYYEGMVGLILAMVGMISEVFLGSYGLVTGLSQTPWLSAAVWVHLIGILTIVRSFTYLICGEAGWLTVSTFSLLVVYGHYVLFLA